MKTKFLACLLAVAMTASLFTACSSKPGDTTNPGSNKTEDSTTQEEKKEPVLDDIVKAVKDAYGEDYLPSIEISKEELTDVYGLTMENVEEVFAEGPMMSGHVDRLIAVKAAQGKGEEVEKELTAYQTILKEDTMMYPMNVARIQASQVVRHGDYVFFLILGAYGDDVNTTEEEQQKFADEQTKIGIDTIASFF